MTEGTKWQCFKSFDVSCGLFLKLWKSMKTFGIMEANECRSGNYGNLSNLGCI